MTSLNGLTWDHPRGYQPLEACALQWRDVEPEVTVQWDRRSLKSFGDDPLEDLSKRYDLVIVDHPFVGTIADQGCFVALDRYLDAATLSRIADSVGSSYDTYRLAGHQWALPVDAAAHVSVRRADLMDDRDAPRTWEQVTITAHELGPDRFILALAPVDCMMMLLTIAASLGKPAFVEETLAGEDDLAAALEVIAQLADLAHPSSLQSNPIAVLDSMSARHGPGYSPALFGYSNYARTPRSTDLRFAPVPAGAGGSRGVLGGAGVAVSSSSPSTEVASKFAAFVADPEVQATTYLDAGGQPSHRTAWKSAEARRVANGYFADTLTALDQSWVRPRWVGFPLAQEAAGNAIHRYLSDGSSRETTALIRELRSLVERAFTSQPASDHKLEGKDRDGSPRNRQT